MKSIAKFAAVAALSVAALGVSTIGASAKIVCNAEGECWHVRGAYAYRPEFGLTVHENGWKWARATSIAGASMKAAATGATACGSASKPHTQSYAWRTPSRQRGRFAFGGSKFAGFSCILWLLSEVPTWRFA